MNLRELFILCLYAHVCLASAMLAYGEGSPFPSGVTTLVAAAAYLVHEKQGRWKLPVAAVNVLGLAAAAAAVGEFLTPNIESRLLAGAHFLVYLTWVVLFVQKGPREFWWLGAFGLLQVAVGAVLTNSGLYGLLLLVDVLLMLWTMAVGNVLIRAVEYRLIDLGGPRNAILAKTSPAVAGFVGRPSRIDRHGVHQDVPGFWIGRRFAGNIIGASVLGVALGVLVFLFVPRFWIGSGNPFLNSSLSAVRARTGFANDVRLGHLGHILEDSTRVFRVRLVERDTDRIIPLEEFVDERGLAGPYFRGAVLDQYEGGRWKTGKLEERFEIAPSSSKPAGLIRQEYFVDVVDSPIICALQPADLGHVMTPYQPLERDALTRVLAARDLRATLQEFYVWSASKGLGLPPLVTVRRDGGLTAVARQYTQTPEGLPRMRELAQKLSSGKIPQGTSKDRYVVDNAIALLRDSGEYSYSLQMRVGDPRIDPVEDFLFNTRQGHCEYFSAALALLLRANQIPSRLITGYKGAQYNSLSDNYEVQRRHSHAWVEAWYDGAWHLLDAVPHQRDEEVEGFHAKQGFWGNARDSLSSFWANYVVSMSIDRQQTSFYDPLTSVWNFVRERGWAVVEGLLAPGDPSSAEFTRRNSALLWIAGGVAVALFALRVLVRRRTARRDGAAFAGTRRQGVVGRLLERWFGSPAAAEIVVRFYERFCELAAARGLVRSPPQTQREFAQIVAARLRTPLDAAGLADFPCEVTDHFYAVRFGGGALSSDDFERLERRMHEFENLAQT